MLNNFRQVLYIILLLGGCFCSKKNECTEYKPSIKCDRVITFDGGLGNQLYQYVFGYIVEKETNTKVCYDKSAFLRKHSNNHTFYALDNYHVRQLTFLDKKEINFYKKKYKPVKEYTHRNSVEYNKKILYPNAGYGYYPNAPLYFSEKYFNKYRNEIKSQLALKMPLDERNKQMLNEIKKYKNSVSLHIRRGDYLKLSWYQTTTIDNYYKKAIKIFEKMPDVHYFIFSNDPEWVKKNLNTGKPTTYVDINDEQHGYFDFELMRNCKHHIIANSTFSAWAAYLTEDTNGIVVTPLHWHRFSPDDKGGVAYDAEQQRAFLSNWIKIDNFAEEWLLPIRNNKK